MRKICFTLIVVYIFGLVSCGNYETLEVVNKDVYDMFSFHEHVKCTNDFDIVWFGNNEETIVFGNVKSGKINFTLPQDIDESFLTDPESIKAYDISPGLRFAVLDGNFRLLKETRKTEKYENHDEMAFVYSTIDGNFKINETTLDLKQGWNLFNNKFKRINNINSLYNKGYKFYAFDNITQDW